MNLVKKKIPLARLLFKKGRFGACLRGGGGPQVGEVNRLGGVTRHMLPHPPGVPHLYVNRP